MPLDVLKVLDKTSVSSDKDKMKKLLPFLFCLNFTLALTANAETFPSADNMEDFHPEITAGEVPTPEIQIEKSNIESLAVIPFEDAGEKPPQKGKREEIEIYPTGQNAFARKTSEPNNPVNNVLKSNHPVNEVLQAPKMTLAPQKQMPEKLFGRP